MQRVDAAKARIESLNPLVTVEILSDSSTLENENLDTLVQSVDLVCATDWDKDVLVSSAQLTNLSTKLNASYSSGSTTPAESGKSHFMLVEHTAYLDTFSVTF